MLCLYFGSPPPTLNVDVTNGGPPKKATKATLYFVNAALHARRVDRQLIHGGKHFLPTKIACGLSGVNNQRGADFNRKVV